MNEHTSSLSTPPAQVVQTQGWEAEGRWFALLCAYARQVGEHPAKGRILRWLFKLAAADGCWMRSPFGARLFVPYKDYIGWEIIIRGAFEPFSIARAIALLTSPSDVFVDVGANQGLFSCAIGAARRCKVVSVEPAPQTFMQLRRNLAANPDIDAETVLCCCASAPGVLSFAVPTGGLNAWAKVDSSTARGGKDSRIWVAGLPLSEVINRCDVSQVSVLKIDVEGYEEEVFKGMNWEAPMRPRHIIMECSPGDEKMISLMKRGYWPRQVDGSSVDAEQFLEGNLWFADIQAERVS